MDEVTLLILALIAENPHELLLKNKKYLEFAIVSLADAHPVKTLAAVIDYAEITGKCPDSFDSLLQFIHANRHENPLYGKNAGYGDEIDTIKEDSEGQPTPEAALLIDSVYRKAFKLRLSNIYSVAASIANGDVSIEEAGTRIKRTGPAVAEEYIQAEKKKLVVKGAEIVSGDLKENIEYIRDYINSYTLGTSERIYTGFKKIDEVCLIGKKQKLRWIGILGYTHHGKSLFLNTMIYNMAYYGANVLFCPRECSIEDAYMQFVWLHYKKVCPERKICSMSDWMRQGNLIPTEEYNTIQYVLKDLQEGNTLKGKLIVEPCETWENIEEILQATNKKNKYDVLAVDYMGHLDTSGGSKQEGDVDKHKRNFRKAQLLCGNGIDNDKSGLVIITPLQANKKGYEETAKQEGDDYGVYKSPIAVEWFTTAAQGMDLLLSVWNEGDLCKNSNPPQMIVGCLKGRGHMRFPTHRLSIQPETGLIMNPDDTDKGLDPERNVNNLSSADIESALYVTTKTITTDINDDVWET